MSEREYRRPNRWLVAAGVPIAAGMIFTGLWFVKRPSELKRRGVVALAAHDWERLQYVELAMPQTRPCAAAKRLFAAALELEDRDFLSAFRDLRLAANDRALRSTAWLLAGEALYAQKRFREAELNFKYALELEPNLVHAHRWLVIAYYDVGLMNETLVHLRYIADLDPSDPRPHRMMGLIHMERGSFAIAIEDYQESLRRKAEQPDREDILAELASCQLAIRRYDDAQQTLASCPKTPEVFAMQAEVQQALGDHEEARRLAEEAIAREPSAVLALSVLGKLAIDDRRYDEAIELLTRAVKAAPSDYGVQYTLVTALRAAGHKDAAEKQLAAAESLRELREEYDGLVDDAGVQPHNAEIRYKLGLKAEQLGLPEIARMWMKAATILDPKHRLALAELKKHGADSVDATQMLRGG